MHYMFFPWSRRNRLRECADSALGFDATRHSHLGDETPRGHSKLDDLGDTATFLACQIWIVYWNPCCRRIFGYLPVKYCQSWILTFVPSAGRQFLNWKRGTPNLRELTRIPDRSITHEEIECFTSFARLKYGFYPWLFVCCVRANLFMSFENSDTMISVCQARISFWDTFIGGF